MTKLALLIASSTAATCRSSVEGAPAPSTPEANAEASMAKSAKDEAQLTEAYRQVIAAMLGRQVAELGALLADEFVLTHMTGARQTKRAWLDAIQSGQMRYHAAQEQSVEVKVRGDTAVLVGKSVVTATIFGAHGTWNLQLTTTCRRLADRWLAVDMVATTF